MRATVLRIASKRSVCWLNEKLSTRAASLSAGLQAEISTALNGRVSTNQTILNSHGKDESWHPVMAPDLVAFPETTEEVSKVVQACARTRTPIIPFGTGTSLEGHIAALHGGVCIDLSKMNRIIEVNAEDMDCRVEAGVTRKALNEHLRDTGLFFSVDPGADASLGGMAATRASGTNTVRYGTMRDNVMGLTAVMPDGSIIKTGKRVKKSSSGYDLTHLMVGSEGTLGVITEVALRLFGLPEAVSAAVCGFSGMESAVDAVVEIMQCGIPVARIELLDEVTISAVNKYSKLSLSPQPTLFFEFHGSEASVAEQAKAVEGIVASYGASGFEWAVQPEDRERLWAARHTAYWASLGLRPGCRGYITDVCVPISRLTECILASQAACKAGNLLAPLVGHVGDGNFHMMMVVDESSPDELAAAQVATRDIVQLAHSMGGTCSGEHGVGYGKLGHLEAEHGMGPLHIMAAIKTAIDPSNIMNPGKMGGPPDSFTAAH